VYEIDPFVGRGMGVEPIKDREKGSEGGLQKKEGKGQAKKSLSPGSAEDEIGRESFRDEKEKFQEDRHSGGKDNKTFS